MMQGRAGWFRSVALFACAFTGVAANAHAQDDVRWQEALKQAAEARQSGQLAEVEKLLKGALAEAEKFGPLDQRVVVSLDALGTYYYQQGIYVEAFPVYTRLLEIRERTLGPDHPAVGDSLDDIAVIENLQGKLAEAEAHAERALLIAERAAAGLSGVTHLAAGQNHTCAIVGAGQVQCWGSNLSGQLGVPGAAVSAFPVTVSKLSNSVALAAGLAFTCALLSDHKVTCWGANQRGQAGATPSELTEPVLVGGILNARAVAAGGEHACALLADGTVKCWGNNEQGQLGNGTTASSASPVTVSGIAGAKAIAAGGHHACAVATDGGVMCWGSNVAGQTGKVGTEPALTPVRVAGLTAPATALAAGANHTCALLADGTVACWGRNQSGQAGTPASARVATPTLVKELARVEGLVAGYSHTCALLADGSVRCWGNNEEGQLGDGKNLNSSSPVVVAGLPRSTALAAGATHTCAVLSDATARCWGTDSHGTPAGVTFSLRSRAPVAVGREASGLTIALNILADVYRAERKFDRAEPLYQRTLSLVEKMRGPQDPSLVPILNGYAEMLRRAGRSEEAAKLDDRARFIQRKPVLIDVPAQPPGPR